jgi:hypothetical protein
MPRTKIKPAESKYVICVQSFASDDVPPPGVIKRKTRLRSDHPIVQRHGHYFVDADTPDNELPNEHHFVPDPEQHETDVRILERLPDDQLTQAISERAELDETTALTIAAELETARRRLRSVKAIVAHATEEGSDG